MMKIELFNKVLEIKIAFYPSELSKAEAIYNYCLRNQDIIRGWSKIGLIKSARTLDKNLGLKEAKDLVEQLFIFNQDGSFEIKK